MGLPLAGTVVDQGLTAKDKFDFYLNSAQGIQVSGSLLFKI